MILNVYLVSQILGIEEERSRDERGPSYDRDDRDRRKDPSGYSPEKLHYQPKADLNVALSNQPPFPRKVTYTNLDDFYNFESADLLNQYTKIHHSVLKELTSLELNRTQLLDNFTDLKMQKEHLEIQISNYNEEISVIQRNIKAIRDEHERLKYEKPKEVVPIGGPVVDIGRSKDFFVERAEYASFQENFDYERCPFFNTNFTINQKNSCLYLFNGPSQVEKGLRSLNITRNIFNTRSNFIIKTDNIENPSKNTAPILASPLLPMVEILIRMHS